MSNGGGEKKTPPPRPPRPNNDQLVSFSAAKATEGAEETALEWCDAVDNLKEAEDATRQMILKNVPASSITDKLADFWFAAKERLLGDDHWIPADCKEIVAIPPSSLPSHRQLLPHGKHAASPPSSDNSASASSTTQLFQLVQGTYKNKPKESVYHVCLLVNKLDPGIDVHSPDESVVKSYSIFRSADLDAATDVYESCMHRSDLFGIIDRKDLKRGIKHLLTKIESHPLWLSIHLAARIGSVAYFVVRQSRGDDMKALFDTACHPEGQHPLHIAIQHNHVDLAKKMVEMGANKATTDVQGCNSLHYAAKASAQMVDVLAFNGSDVAESEASLLNAINNDGCTPLFVAIRSVNPLCTRALIRADAALNYRCRGRSPLHEAVQQTSAKCSDVIRALVESCPEIVMARDPATGNTALHAAAAKPPLNALLSVAGDRLDVNAKNDAGQSALHIHAHRGDLGCVMALAAYGADLDAQDAALNTALHIAASWAFVDLVKALIALGANPSTLNKQQDSARHLAAKLKCPEREELVRCLSVGGVPRCPPDKVGCSSGCADRKTLHLLHSESVAKLVLERPATPNDALDDTAAPSPPSEPTLDLKQFAHEKCVGRIRRLLEADEQPRIMNLLSLDGGGIRGLALIQILMELEAIMGEPIWPYFDWVAGTSTGSFISAGLATGKSLRDCQRLYLRFKDTIFESWTRPYSTSILEQFIQQEIGHSLTMADIEWPRFAITTVLADKHPVQLLLLRNYRLPYLNDEENSNLGYSDPKDQLLWKALRASSAAPTYFSSFEGKYVDGGLISNNPTLDLLGEVHTWNTCLDYKNRPDVEKVNLGIVLNVGTGRIPDIPIDSLDFEISANPYSAAMAVKNLGFMLIEQVTATEGAPADRARCWCEHMGVPFYRFSTPMTKNVLLDTRDDREIVHLLWDAVEYLRQQRPQLEQLAEVLKLLANRRPKPDVV